MGDDGGTFGSWARELRGDPSSRTLTRGDDRDDTDAEGG